MAKPTIHSKNSVAKFGGVESDYHEIHDFMDISKSAHADMRHRMVLHHALGCYIAEKVFGRTIVNAEGKEVNVRDIAEQHILDDLGFIPSLTEWVNEMNQESWMNGLRKIKFEVVD